MLTFASPPAATGGPSAIDFFCGMGGSSTGLQRSGFTVRLAANHWDRAIETHSANHPGTDHWCADVSAYDMRVLPRADVLWASPICIEVSPGGGRKKRSPQMDLLEEAGHVPDAAYERTRITFWEVIRACEVQRFKIVLIENVVEAAAWELFDVWLAGMKALGYEVQFVSVSAAHVAALTPEAAPQWRDRLYMVFNQVGVRRPVVEPRPLAPCESCGNVVEAVQAWKRPGRHIGKYRAQYFYVCPEVGCRSARVEPFVTPSAAAIDWSDLGTPIGDRDLVPATMRRIQAGLDRFAGAGEPILTTARRNSHPYLASSDAAPTFTGGGFHHELTVPPGSFVSKHHGDVNYVGIAHMNKSVGEPLPTMVATVNNSLVVPFRKGSPAHRAAGSPFSVMSTVDTHSLVTPMPVDINDCLMRMLSPREAASAQGFSRSYVMHGNKGERQMQAGNAVAVNVAAWLGGCVLPVLDAA